jgi:predicted transcriptional regulator
MPINDFCFKNIVTISKDASLADAAKLMRDERIGAIVVANKSKKAVGVLTDRDIVVGAVAEGKPMNAKVAEVMSKDVLRVPKGAGAADVIEKMEKREVRRAVVVDGHSHPCGLISSDDLVQLLGIELNSLGNLVSRQIANEGAARAVQ